MNEQITTVAELPGRLYVAGPMSGLPNYNYPAFNYAAGELRVAGFEVENPADNTVESDDYHDYLRAGLAQLERCGGVAVLEGWWLSGGARWEVQTAGVLGLPVRSVDEWLKLASPDAPARTEPTEEQVRTLRGQLFDAGYREAELLAENKAFVEEIREAKAEAWDEGLSAAYGHVYRQGDADAAGQGVLLPSPANPYRSEADHGSVKAWLRARAERGEA